MRLSKYNTNKGLYIAIDGPDGCGKSTIVNLLKKQSKVRVFSEPDRNGQMWPTIRDYRTSGKYPDELWFFILSAASLEQQIRDDGLIDCKNKGWFVFTDRSPLSLLALHWHSIDEDFFKRVLRLFSPPDVLIVLYPKSPKLLVQRMIDRGDNFNDIASDMKFYDNYFEAARWLKKNFNWNICFVSFDEMDTPSKVCEKIKKTAHISC